jgi:hypothetical protein
MELNLHLSPGKLKLMLDEDFIESKFGKVKITEIPGETRVHTRRERMRDGTWQAVTRELTFKRPLVTASGWARLFHFVIDMYFISFVLSTAISFLFPTTRDGSHALIFLVCVPSYFITTEYFLQRTLPKLLTRSIVVDEYGQRPSFGTVVLRTLIRFVPFEPFSHLSAYGGWHDRWTKTFVLRESELEEIRKLLLEQKYVDTKP